MQVLFNPQNQLVRDLFFSWFTQNDVNHLRFTSCVYTPILCLNPPGSFSIVGGYLLKPESLT